MVKIATQAGDGKVAFASESVLITCTDAVVKGQIVKLTLAAGAFTACEATTEATDDVVLTPFGVALDAVSAGKKGRIGLRGVFDCNVDGNTAAGNALIISNDADGQLIPIQAASGTPAEYTKVHGIALEADTDNVASVLFDGINGFAATAVAAQG
jgi:hypothetical protein